MLDRRRRMNLAQGEHFRPTGDEKWQYGMPEKSPRNLDGVKSSKTMRPPSPEDNGGIRAEALGVLESAKAKELEPRERSQPSTTTSPSSLTSGIVDDPDDIIDMKYARIPLAYRLLRARKLQKKEKLEEELRRVRLQIKQWKILVGLGPLWGQKQEQPQYPHSIHDHRYVDYSAVTEPSNFEITVPNLGRGLIIKSNELVEELEKVINEMYLLKEAYISSQGGPIYNIKDLNFEPERKADPESLSPNLPDNGTSKDVLQDGRGVLANLHPSELPLHANSQGIMKPNPAALSDASLIPTISKDHTMGEDVRKAELLAVLGQKLLGRRLHNFERNLMSNN